MYCMSAHCTLLVFADAVSLSVHSLCRRLYPILRFQLSDIYRSRSILVQRADSLHQQGHRNLAVFDCSRYVKLLQLPLETTPARVYGLCSSKSMPRCQAAVETATIALQDVLALMKERLKWEPEPELRMHVYAVEDLQGPQGSPERQQFETVCQTADVFLAVDMRNQQKQFLRTVRAFQWPAFLLSLIHI